jgi:hypothetical protein
VLRKSVAANAILAPSGGKIGMGETRPGNSLEVEIGGATLADHWSTRSSPRWKTNMHTLDGAPETAARLPGVSYARGDCKLEIGVTAKGE